MNTWYSVAILAIIQSVLAGLITHVLKAHIVKRDEKEQSREAARLKRDKLLLQATIANSELAYAVVAAIKRGTPNGEVEIAEKAYHEAMSEYKEFIEIQGIESLHR